MGEYDITEKQFSYLEALCEKTHRPVQVVLGEARKRGLIDNYPDHLCDLSKGEASKIISWLKEELEYGIPDC